MALLAIPILMLVLAVPIGVLVLIGLAIKNRNIALALFIAGGAAVMLCLVAIILALSYAHVSSTATVVGPNVWAATTPGQTFQQLPQPGVNYVVHNSWGMNLWSIMIFIFLLGILGFLIARRMTARSACGPHRAWPVCLLIPVLIFLFFRLHVASQGVPPANIASPSVGAQAPSNYKFTAHKSANQQQKKAVSVSENINQEIEEFDAPRIPLAPITAAPTAAAPAAVAPTAPTPAASPPVEQAAATKKDSSSSKVSHSTSKKKKSEVAADKSKAKPAQPAVNSSEKAAATTQTEKPSAKSEKFAGERPAWVDRPPHHIGNTSREVIATDEYQSEQECYQAADIYLLLRTYQHMQQLAGIPSARGPLPSISFNNGYTMGDGIAFAWNGPTASMWIDARLRDLSEMGIGTEYIYREIVAKDPSDNEPREFLDTVQRSIGQMKKLYLEIEFTPDVDRELRQLWFAHARHERFAIIGVIGGNVLIVLGFIFALLKLDTWTKGYYTKRLFIGVPAAIIVGLLIVGLFVGHRF